MLDLRLKYEGGGRFQTATRLDLELAEKTFEAGEECAGKITHKRSVRQNNTFHVMIQFAHDNQRAGPVLPSWEHLKQWLLIKAGHYTERRFEVGKLNKIQAETIGKALAHFLRSNDGYVAVAYDPSTGEFIERKAASVRFKAVMSDDMAVLFDKVADIICREIIPGTDADELVEMAKASCKGNRRAA